MRRGLSVGSISCEVISGQMSWPGAGAAAGSSHELHFNPPGWYSAPKAMRIIPHCARWVPLLRSVDGLPGRKMWSAMGPASCSLWAGGSGVEGRQGVVIFRP